MSLMLEPTIICTGISLHDADVFCLLLVLLIFIYSYFLTALAVLFINCNLFSRVETFIDFIKNYFKGPFS